ncbi:MAG TPA: sulfite oxidase-like oxidoreductase [Gemmatimonadales bacterium]|nr:sulfite oxidase-like oxidoreductase [Gemmatimonadales bacterium]
MTDRLDARPTDRDRLPPGQILTQKWPVLHYQHVPLVDTATWRLTVTGEVETPLSLSWAELLALPQRDVLCDMHCVTRWSRYDNIFTGVPVREVLRLAGARAHAEGVMLHGAEGYTTNLPMSDLDREENLIATHWNREPLTAEHGGPVRLLVPHLYLWKSAKWLTGIEILEYDEPGFWEMNGYHMRGEPWAEQRFGRPDPVRMRRGPRR